jgi:hypothetical protein
MSKVYERTVQCFVEDLLSDGRTGRQVIIIAQNTRWKTRVDEVKSCISEFNGKLSKKFIAF